jgi:GT2 family glycosyltransferase
MSTAPRVEILLLNWKGWRDTIECLDSILALEYSNFGIIVCDNDSPDGSVEKIEAWARGERDAERSFTGRLPRDDREDRRPLRTMTVDRATAESGSSVPDDVDLLIIRTGDNLGFSGGNNVGLRYLQARGGADYVWMLNNDTVVAPYTLSQLVSVPEADERIGVVGGTMLEFDEPDVVQYFGGASFATWRGRITLLGHGRPASDPRPASPPLDYVSGGCMLVPMRVIDEVGLLDERFFMYSEDADWCFRIRDAGYRVAYAPHADVWHKGGASSVPGSQLHDYHNMVGNLLVMQKHHPWHMPFTVPYCLYRYLAPKIVRRQWTRAAAVARAFRDVARGRTGARAAHRPVAEPRPAAVLEPLVSVDAP